MKEKIGFWFALFLRRKINRRVLSTYMLSG